MHRLEIMSSLHEHTRKYFPGPLAVLVLVCLAVGGCTNTTAPPPVSGPSAFIDDTSDLSAYSSPESPPDSVQVAPTISEIRKWSDRFDGDPASYDNAIGFARVLMVAGSLERAIEVIDDALVHHPGDSALLFIQARAYLQQGNTGSALRALDATGADPDWRHFSLRGICLDQLDRHKQAQKAYQSALHLSPGNAKIYNNLGLSYALSGDPEQAEATLRKAMSLDGSSAQIRQNLALVLGVQGKFTEAEKISAKDLEPNQVQDNLEYYRWLLTPRRTWDELSDTSSGSDGLSQETGPRSAPR